MKSKEALVETLKKVSFFSGLPAEGISSVSSKIRCTSYKKDEYIFHEGDICNSLYVLASGKLKIIKQMPSGKEMILEILEKGEIFGAVALFSGGPLPASSVTLESSEVLSLPKKDFDAIGDKYPQIVTSFTRILGKRLMTAHEIKKNIALDKVEIRIAKELLRFHEKLSKGHDEIKVTRKELSEIVGTTVETSIRVLSRFGKEGLIESDRGVIRICNINKIRELVDSNE
jgi:CRP/FNR family transcriptional regulator